MGGLDVGELAPQTVALGVTDAHRTLATQGPTGRVFPILSVTKLLVAYATLLAVDRGRLELDDEVADAGEHRTLRHLLAHASGVGPDADAPATDPERRRIYSNHGYELIGEEVGDAVGRPIAEWLRTQVLEPLGMHDTVLDGSPAHGARSSVDDLLRFARELLEPTLLDAALLQQATTAQWPDLDGVLPGYGRQTPNPWGLGFELRGSKDPHWLHADFPPGTFGHFGRSGSFVFADPDAGRGGVFLADRDFGQWAVEAWPEVTRTMRELSA